MHQHMEEKHTGDEASFRCDRAGCDKLFTRPSKLRRHVATHIARDAFTCSDYPPCSSSFRKAETLERHVLKEHKQLDAYPCNLVDPQTGAICEKSFTVFNNLTRHQYNVHTNPKPKIFSCDDCAIGTAMGLQPRTFASKSELRRHQDDVHSTCPQCLNKYSGQRELEKHMQTQHSDVSLLDRKTFICTEFGCDKSYTKQSSLNMHVQTAHHGARFHCDSYDLSDRPGLKTWEPENDGCDKSFHSKANLEDHVRMVHYKMPSKINANRKRAQRRRDDAMGGSDVEFSTQPPKKRSFRQKPDAIERVMGIDPRRVFLCPSDGCGRSFMRKYDLFVHQSSQHWETAMTAREPGPAVHVETSRPSTSLAVVITRPIEHQSTNVSSVVQSGIHESLLTSNAVQSDM